jgi:hypothetical protein
MNVTKIHTPIATDNLTLNWPVVPCCMPQRTCVCGKTERALRWIAAQAGRVLQPNQLEWCLDQIGQVEGYDRREWENEEDQTVAAAVLQAWADAARDKGML